MKLRQNHFFPFKSTFPLKIRQIKVLKSVFKNLSFVYIQVKSNYCVYEFIYICDKSVNPIEQKQQWYMTLNLKKHFFKTPLNCSNHKLQTSGYLLMLSQSAELFK